MQTSCVLHRQQPDPIEYRVLIVLLARPHFLRAYPALRSPDHFQGTNCRFSLIPVYRSSGSQMEAEIDYRVHPAIALQDFLDI